MTAHIKRVICEKVQQIAFLKNIYCELEVPTKKQLASIGKPALQWTLPAGVIENQKALLSALKTLEHGDDIDNVHLRQGEGKQAAKIEFQLNAENFTKQILKLENQIPTTAEHNKKECIVLDFSSPNIAKPFHVGHLRSTIIGNVLSNLHRYLGYRTVNLNYLGDWGTQFGLLALGVQLTGVSDAEMRLKPIETLYRAYVEANKAAEADTSLAMRARETFTKLETGEDADMTHRWQQYRQYTVEELSQVYARLGVNFDSYEWESQYSQREISSAMEQLRSAGLLLQEQDGRSVVQVDERRVPIIKSDGSTLYLARDIAALLDRQERFNFKRMLYVVDNAQTDHFKALFSTVVALRKDLPSSKLEHVKFGRIHGMSTRQGKAIFLRDVLDEACNIMREKRINSTTTKNNSTLNDERVCDILGISAVIINDLKQRRQRDYNFNWQQALQVNGDTGIKLQYTHCRLHSLLENFSHVDLTNVKPNWHLLREPEAEDLLYEISRFEQSIWSAQQQLEACVLVNYLFSLCNTTSRALKRLPVKLESSAQKQAQRLLLFNAAKNALHQGMKILGLHPLEQM